MCSAGGASWRGLKTTALDDTSAETAHPSCKLKIIFNICGI